MSLVFYRSWFEKVQAEDKSGHFNGILVNTNSIDSGSLVEMSRTVRDEIMIRNQASNSDFFTENKR